MVKNALSGATKVSVSFSRSQLFTRILKEPVHLEAEVFGVSVRHLSSTFGPYPRGVQPFGVSGPHWKKKSCLGPHIKYTN